jgi:hypothetical protein
MEWRTVCFLWFALDFKFGFNFVDFGGPGGPAGAAGTPTIAEIKADFEIYNKPKNVWSPILR